MDVGDFRFKRKIQYDDSQLGWYRFSLEQSSCFYLYPAQERYTYEFIEKNDMLTLSFLGSGNRSIYNICGSKSGRDTDKIKESGLLPLTTPDGNVTFEQARLTLECRKLYGQLLSPEHFIDKSLPDKWYGAQGNFHKVYVVEILKVWEK